MSEYRCITIIVTTIQTELVFQNLMSVGIFILRVCKSLLLTGVRYDNISNDMHSPSIIEFSQSISIFLIIACIERFGN